MKTEQELFWRGDFGSNYINRNCSPELVSSGVNFFSKALNYAHEFSTCIEFGANIGVNLKALKVLFPTQKQYAVELNSTAAEILAETIPLENITTGSVLDFKPNGVCDLVLVKGLLIHINPDYLDKVYDIMHKSCGKYMLICEYYNPSPVSIPYRGHSNKLFKRDFCGEILDKFEDLSLIDYGFSYHRDHNFPQDDITWFLLEKSTRKN